MTPYVSIICPSRGRPQLIIDSFDTLETLAGAQVEYLVRLDWQDSTIPQYLEVLRKYGNKVKVIVGDQLQRYLSVHEFTNELCAIASAPWCFLWNDDCVMQTANWCAALTPFDGKHAILHPQDNTNAGTCFPIFSRTIYTLQGGFVSKHVACDWWLQEIAGRGAVETARCAINITHRRPGMPDGIPSDETYGAARSLSGKAPCITSMGEALTQAHNNIKKALSCEST